MKESSKVSAVPEDLKSMFCDARDHEPDLIWNYSARGVIRRGETSVLYGPSNCGKSVLVCHLGHCLATGKEFFGARVTKGMVVHVGAEAPKSILDRMKAYDICEADASPYIVGMSPVNLADAEEVETFISSVKRILCGTGEKLILTAFDTLARSMGSADENCANTMTRIAQNAEHIAKMLNTHVMIVHHTGKDADRGGRGSSALRGAVDTELSLRPVDGGVLMTHEKQRSMPKGPSAKFKMEPFILGTDEDGENRTTVKAVELPNDDNAGKRSSGKGGDCEMAVLTALHIRSMTGTRAHEPFRPRDIVETLPAEVFGGIAVESRIRNVSRSLGVLATRREAIVKKVKDGWQLTGPSGNGTSSQ